MSSTFELFAVCLPGFEAMLADELRELGLDEVRPDAGGVAFRGDHMAVYRANLCSGLSSQVLLRVGDFHCRSLGELARKSAALDWPQLLRGDTPLQIKATSRKSRLYHTGAIAERVLQGINESLGATAPAGGLQDTKNSEVTIRVRLEQDQCTLSVDTSGEPLHRRGYRTHIGKAPLREDLARGLIVASGWDHQRPLVDPLMGSGVILIEAAQMARRLAPGRLRNFAFEKTRLFDFEAWARLRDEVAAVSVAKATGPIGGSDRDPRAVASAIDNAERAGVLDDLTLQQSSLRGAPWISDATPPPTGQVITNPPYGRRLGNPESLVPLYQSLGFVMNKLQPGWDVCLLAMDRRLAFRSGLPLETAFLADNGGLKVRALRTSSGDPQA